VKYKVGDCVKIKTWKELEEEFGLDSRNREVINCYPHCFIKQQEESLSGDRVVRIRVVHNFGYYVEDIQWYWNEKVIERLASEEEIGMLSPVENRFELLDL